MYCSKCGGELSGNVSSCKNCEEKTIVTNTKLESGNEEKSEPESSKSIFSGILGVVIFILALALGKFMGLVALLLYVSFYAGQKISKWYLKRKNINESVVNFISWSNVITWIFPILGLFTAAFAIESGEMSEDKGKKYLILGYVGSVFSILNSIAGIIINS